MTSIKDVAEKRWDIDPRESPATKGDYVTISSHNILWEVTKVSRDGSTIYLRSVDGHRLGIESSNRVRSIWRDPEAIVEIDWSQAYNEEETDE